MTTEFDALCPHCGYRPEAHSNLNDDASPSPGDISICWSCTEVSRFGKELELEPMSAEVYDRVVSDPDVKRMILMVRFAKRKFVAEKN